MGDKNRPRSKTGRSPSSNSLRDRQRANSKAANSPEVEPEVEIVENTLSWDVLSKEQITELLSLSPSEILPKICGILPSPDTHINLKNSIKADLYLLLFYFAKNEKFTEFQTGALVTLYKHIISQIEGNKELMEVVLESSRYLTCSKEYHPGMKFDMFTPEQTTKISHYLSSGIFQHYKLYQFTLLREQEQTIISLEKVVSTCPPLGSFDPPPLAEAISDHDVETYLNAAPPESPRPVEEAEGEEGAPVEEGHEQDQEANPLISLANVQTVLDTVGVELIDKFSKDMKVKCTEKENQYINRLNKVKKAID